MTSSLPSDDNNSSDQLAVNQLREELTEFHSEPEKTLSAYLLKWLRAQEMNVNNAAEMIRTSMIWRRTNEMDEILQWTPPEALVGAFPLQLSGFDDDGNAIMIAPLKYANSAFYSTVSKEDYVKFRCHIIEVILESMKNRNKEVSLPGNQIIIIYDLEGFNVKSLLRPKNAEFVIEASKVIDANYPDVIKRVYVTYAPWMITIVAAFFKPFTPKADIEKTKVFGSNVSKWGPELTQHIPPTSLPIRYGGTSTNLKFE